MPLGQSKKDEQWPACLACAVVERKRQYRNMERSGVCEECFERYCWNGADTFDFAKEAAKHPDKIAGAGRRRLRGDDLTLLVALLSSLSLAMLYFG